MRGPDAIGADRSTSLLSCYADGPVAFPEATGLSFAFMVPAHGFEPRFAASKADVLPLDEAGLILKRIELSRTSHRNRERA